MVHEIVKNDSSKLKTTVLTMCNGFDLEKLVAKDKELFISLCEKYPLKSEMIYIIKCNKIEENAELAEDVKVVKDEEPKPVTVEDATPVEVETVNVDEVEIDEPTADGSPNTDEQAPVDFEPLYKDGENIKVEFDYGREIKTVTILQSKFTNGEYEYKCCVDKLGIRFFKEQFLVDNEVIEE